MMEKRDAEQRQREQNEIDRDAEDLGQCTARRFSSASDWCEERQRPGDNDCAGSPIGTYALERRGPVNRYECFQHGARLLSQEPDRTLEALWARRRHGPAFTSHDGAASRRGTRSGKGLACNAQVVGRPGIENSFP